MRLRAEYLYSIKEFQRIRFHFTNGFLAEYSKWMEGYRIKVDGNKVWWEKLAAPENTYSSFLKFMEQVFIYAGTLSLDKELKLKNITEMRIGDVFIKGGSPGHAMIIVDMATNPSTGETLYLLAQSYMPAQDIHIVKNLNQPEISPWYTLKRK